MIDIYNVSLFDLLPTSLKYDEEIQTLISAIDPELQEISNAITETLIMPRVDDLPENVLDHLAWQFHVDFYESDFPVSQKREIIKKSYLFHKTKGTPAAVEELISIVFGQGRVLEWFEYGGEPYHFKIRTNNFSVINENNDLFLKALNSIKNRRSHFEIVEFEQTYPQSIYLAQDYTSYKYNFVGYSGEFVTGTGPDGHSTLGRLTEQNIKLEQSFYRYQKEYDFSGHVLTGTDEKIEQLQLSTATSLKLENQFFSNVKNYNFSSEYFMCGTGVI